jgi:hypothetical protein
MVLIMGLAPAPEMSSHGSASGAAQPILDGGSQVPASDGRSYSGHRSSEISELDRLCPLDAGIKNVEVTSTDPGRLRLNPASSERFTGGKDGALLLDDARDDIVRNGDPVGVAEDIDTPSTIRAARIAQPADALLVVAKRRYVLQRVGNVEEVWGGPGMVPVDEPNDVVTLKDAVPGPEVAMADDLSRRAGPRAARPHTVGRGPVAGDGVVVASQEAGPAPQAVLSNNLGPTSRAGLTFDPTEHFEVTLGVQHPGGREVDLLKVIQKSVYGQATRTPSGARQSSRHA